MDILILLALIIGICYGLVRAARWAIRIDSQTPKRSKHRKTKPKAEDKAISDAFFEIIRPIWKRPTDGK